MEVLECEVGFYDAGGFDPGSEDILLGGLVVSSPNPIQAVQVAGDGNTQETMDYIPGHCSRPTKSFTFRVPYQPGTIVGNHGGQSVGMGATEEEGPYGPGLTASKSL